MNRRPWTWIGGIGALAVVVWVIVRGGRDGAEEVGGGSAMSVEGGGAPVGEFESGREVRVGAASDRAGEELVARGQDEELAKVQGRVVGEASTALVEARVRLVGGGVVVAEAFSGASGRYELTLPELPGGELELHCEAPGHRAQKVAAVVVPGHYDFKLRAAVRGLTGTVIGDRFDEPVAGASVIVWDERGREELVRTESDAHGRYAFTRLAPGLVQISAAAPGYASAFVGVRLAEGEETPELTLRIGWSEEPVQIQVVDATGSMPIADAIVRGNLGESHRTDEAGFFRAAPARVGRLWTVEAEGYCTTSRILLPADPAPRIELERAGRFGVRLRAFSELEPLEVTMEQQPEGGLPARRVSATLVRLSEEELVATAEGLAPSLATVALVRGPRARAQSCEARGQAQASQVDGLPWCELVAGRVLRGTVRTLDGEPVSLATVALFEVGGFERQSRILSPSRAVLAACERRASTDANGTFVFRGLDEGLFELVPSVPGCVLETVVVRVPTSSDPVLVLHAREGAAGEIVGTCSSTNGQPIPNAFVRAIDPDGYVTIVRSDDAGRFRFSELAPGAYKLGLSLLQGTEVRSWTSKELHPLGERAVVLEPPWDLP
jgi:hypothetical protein